MRLLAIALLLCLGCGDQECVYTSDAGPCFEYSDPAIPGTVTRCCRLTDTEPVKTACHTRTL